MLRQRNVKLIMLPQALGPFNNHEIAFHAREVLIQFDLIFTRESVFKRHLIDICIEENKIDTCPDISHLLHYDSFDSIDDWLRRVTILPNARMLYKAEPTVSGSTLIFRLCL